MFTRILRLEWKSFFRSANFTKGIAIKIFLAFFALYLMVCFAVLGAGSYFFVAKAVPTVDPLLTISRYIVIWFLADLLLRFFAQKLPVLNSKALMVIPIKKKTIVHYLLLKSNVSAFNIIPLFFFLPFSVVLLIKGYAIINVLFWLLSMVILIQVNNFINFIINKSNQYFYAVASLLAVGVSVEYFNFYDVITPIGNLYFSLYKQPFFTLIPLGLLVLFYVINFKHFLQHFYLEEGVLAKKEKVVSGSEFSWLNRFGDVAPFLKNDIKLIWRNKRPRMTVIMSLLMLFYGLIFFTNPTYGEGSSIMHVFASIFITGMFLMNFGQFIPSWDSAYFNLLMSQNISMKQYLNSKRMLLLLSIGVLTLLSLPYFYFGWKIGVLLLIGGVYNAGVNVPALLYLCTFNKKRVDLAKSAIMNYEGMGMAQWLMIIPMVLIPMGIFSLISFLVSFNVAVVVLFCLGVLGLIFQGYIFSKLVNVFKKRKYAMVIGFQQK
jgi:hypothetical protein